MSYTIAVLYLSFDSAVFRAKGEAMLLRLSEDYSLTGMVTR